MDLFKNSRMMKAIMRDFHGGMEAVRETELARKKCITILLDVPVTAAMKEQLAPWIVQFLNSIGGHTDAKGKRTELDAYSFKASVQFLSPNNKNVLAECGFGESEPCTVIVPKFFFVDATEMMRLKIKTEFNDALWVVGGQYLGDGELYVKTKPHQGNLKLDADSPQAKDDDLDDPGEKIAKKKAGKKPAEQPEAAQV